MSNVQVAPRNLATVQLSVLAPPELGRMETKENEARLKLEFFGPQLMHHCTPRAAQRHARYISSLVGR